MCDYCNDIINYNNKDLLRIDKKHGAFLVHENKDEYILGIEFDGVELSYICFDVSYCPCCGKKLGGE